MAMIGVTCSTMAKGMSARSSAREREMSSASATPPNVASASASSVIVSVTSSEEKRIARSFTSVSR